MDRAITNLPGHLEWKESNFQQTKTAIHSTWGWAALTNDMSIKELWRDLRPTDWVTRWLTAGRPKCFDIVFLPRDRRWWDSEYGLWIQLKLTHLHLILCFNYLSRLEPRAGQGKKQQLFILGSARLINPCVNAWLVPLLIIIKPQPNKTALV